MKKIINNKVYDTDKATRLGFWANMGDRRNFRRMGETLYRKRTGEYFLYGEGGQMTKYAVSVSDNVWSGGEKIIPLSAEKAREWAEEHLDAEDYIKIFGDPGEDGEKESLYVTLPADVAAFIRWTAQTKKISLSACVEEMIKSVRESTKADS